MNRLGSLVLIIGVLALISAGLSLVVGTPAGEDPTAFRSLLAISLPVTVLHIGAALLFLTGLGSFKAGVKVAYGFMCAGFILLGITFLQPPIFSLFNLWDTPYVEFGGIILPLLLSAPFLYVGVRKFSRLLSINNFWSSFWRATLAAIMLVTVVCLVPHPPKTYPELFVDITNSLHAIVIAYLSFASMAIYRIRQQVSPRFMNAMAWLFIVLVVAVLANIHHMLLGLILDRNYPYQTYGLSTLPHVLDGALAVMAAYAFCRVSVSDRLEDVATVSRTFFGRSLAPRDESEKKSAISAVIYLAGLASNHRAINDILNDLRVVTAEADKARDLPESEQLKLVEIYRRLETYLVEAEPLRKFSRPLLRQQVQRKCHFEGQDVHFWAALQAA